MMWWIIGTVVFLMLLFGYALAKVAGDSDRRLAEMRDNDEYTRGG